jgi:hypothetical protein
MKTLKLNGNDKIESKITFCVENAPILIVDEDGFHYKGQVIEDAGEAWKLFTDYMNKINKIDILNELEKWINEEKEAITKESK